MRFLRGVSKELRSIVLFSGGKDSNLALWYAVHQGWDVQLLLSIVPGGFNSYLFHYPNVKWAKLQAEALGYPIRILEIREEGEKEVQSLEEVLRNIKEELDFEAVISGAVESDYQKSRFDRICEHIGVHSIAPLWRKDPLSLLRIEVEMGFKIMVTACMALGFDQSWLGRYLNILDVEEISKIHERFRVNPVFEGGEAETFVADSPLFRHPIRILDSEKLWYGDRGYLIIKDAMLDSRDLPNESGYRRIY